MRENDGEVMDIYNSFVSYWFLVGIFYFISVIKIGGWVVFGKWCMFVGGGVVCRVGGMWLLVEGGGSCVCVGGMGVIVWYLGRRFVVEFFEELGVFVS